MSSWRRCFLITIQLRTTTNYYITLTTPAEGGTSSGPWRNKGLPIFPSCSCSTIDFGILPTRHCTCIFDLGVLIQLMLHIFNEVKVHCFSSESHDLRRLSYTCFVNNECNFLRFHCPYSLYLCHRQRVPETVNSCVPSLKQLTSTSHYRLVPCYLATSGNRRGLTASRRMLTRVAVL